MTEYVVTWQTVVSAEGRVTQYRATFPTLEGAMEKKAAVLRKNDLFVEVDGHKPYILMVRVTKVITETMYEELDLYQR